MDLIIQSYFARAIQEWERAISCKGAFIVAGNQRILLLISCDDSSRIIHEGIEEGPIILCLRKFAAQNKQSPLNMLNSLLREFISEKEGIPEAMAQDVRKENKAIGGRGLQVSGISKMFQTTVATRRTILSVDALDECVPEHRMLVLESLRSIPQWPPNSPAISSETYVGTGIRAKLPQING